MKKVTLGVLLAIASFNLYAGTVVCAGTIEQLSYHSPDRLMIRLSSMNAPVFFCSPDSNWTVSGTGYTTGPATCKALYATFLTAKATGRSLSVVYFDGDQVPAACNSWTSWSNANIRYFAF